MKTRIIITIIALDLLFGGLFQVARVNADGTQFWKLVSGALVPVSSWSVGNSGVNAEFNNVTVDGTCTNCGTGGGGGSSTVLHSASTPYLTFSNLVNGSQTGTLASVLSVQSSTDTNASAATGTNVQFTFASHNVSQFTNDSGYIKSAPATTTVTAGGTATGPALSVTTSTGSKFDFRCGGSNCTSTIPSNISFFTNDSNYLTGNQTITLTGDVTGSGATSIATTFVNNQHYITAASATLFSALQQFGAGASSTVVNAGTITASTSISISGNAVSTSTGANPTANIGTSAVNGTSPFYMRADGAPSLSSQFASSSVTFNIYDATTTSPYNFSTWIPSKQITVAKVLCNAYSAATTTIQLYQATAFATTTNGGDLVSSIVCGNAGATTSSISNATVNAGIPIIANVSSTQGTPTWVELTVNYKTN